MHITRYQPWGLFRGLQDDLDRLVESRLAMDDTSSTIANWVPAVDIKEEKDRFVIRADVPGVKPEDIEITMENGILTIDGHRESEQTEERDDYRRTEHSSWYRQSCHRLLRRRYRTDVHLGRRTWIDPI